MSERLFVVVEDCQCGEKSPGQRVFNNIPDTDLAHHLTWADELVDLARRRGRPEDSYRVFELVEVKP